MPIDFVVGFGYVLLVCGLNPMAQRGRITRQQSECEPVEFGLLASRAKVV